MLGGCSKEGILKVAFEPVPEGRWRAGAAVGNHGLSPLTDRTLQEVPETAAGRRL